MVVDSSRITGFDVLGLKCWQWQEIVLLSVMSRSALGPPAFYLMGPRILHGVKWLGREVHSSPPKMRVRISGATHLLLLYTFMAWTENFVIF